MASIARKISGIQSLSSLASANFRWFLMGSLVSSMGRWGGTVAFAWLALDLTGSKFATGAVIAVKSAGYILSPIAGTIADRYNRKTIMMVISGFSIGYALVLALLITTGAIQYWHLFVISAVSSLAQAFDNPVRKTLAADLVDPKYITSSYALTVVATDTTAIGGPALIGALIEPIGVGGVMWMMVGIYAVNILALAKIKIPPVQRKESTVSPIKNLIDGGKYIWGYQAILALIIMAVVANGLMAGHGVFVPIFAKEIFDKGPGGYGLLLSAAGVGGLMGSLAVVFLGNFRHKAKLSLASTILMGIFVVAFALSPSFWTALPLAAIVGMNSALFLTLGNALLLELAPSNMRGRVMGVRGLCLLAHLPSALLAGALAEMYGTRSAGVMFGIVTVVVMLGVTIFMPDLARVDTKKPAQAPTETELQTAGGHRRLH